MCFLYLPFNVVRCKLFAQRMGQKVARLNNSESANLNYEQCRHFPLFRFVERVDAITPLSL